MDFSGLARYEWLLFELAVLGWAGWQLWSLRRDRLRSRKPASGGTERAGRNLAEPAPPAPRSPGAPPDDRLK